MSNLFLTMMDRMGVHAENFGDSTGRIEGLDLAWLGSPAYRAR
jgi:hypothetical protein